MGDRVVDVVDDTGRQVERQVLGGPVVVGSRRRARHNERVVAVHGDAARTEGRDDPRHELGGDRAMHEQRLGGVADARP